MAGVGILTDVLVHVEGSDVLEGDAAFLIKLDELPIHAERRAPGGQAQHEVASGPGRELADALQHELRRPLRYHARVFQNDEPHCRCSCTRLLILVVGRDLHNLR